MHNLIIVGIKKFTPYLAQELVQKNFKVTVIDTDPLKCRELKTERSLRVLNGDATDPSILEEAGIKRSNILLALTGSDSINLEICKVAKKDFHTEKTLAWLDNPHNEDACQESGIFRCFNVVDKITVELEESLQRSDMESYIRVTKLLESAKKLFRKANLLKTATSDRKEVDQKAAGKIEGYEESAKMIEDVVKQRIILRKNGDA